jgi:hypothetical protein
VKYAVFLDYGYNGQRNTVVLGGSINSSFSWVCEFLRDMSDWKAVDRDGWLSWEVDEDDLPNGYYFQTYYVSDYDPNQMMIGVS